MPAVIRSTNSILLLDVENIALLRHLPPTHGGFSAHSTRSSGKLYIE